METKPYKETINNLKANIQYLAIMNNEFESTLLEELEEVANYIKALEDENLANKPTQLQKIDYYKGEPIAICHNGEYFYNLERLRNVIGTLYSTGSHENRSVDNVLRHEAKNEKN